MHSGLHTLAHRAPTGARSKVRWQPYASLQASVSSTSIPSRSPQTSYLNTPTSVSSSSPYSTPASSYSDRSRPTPPSSSSSSPSSSKDPQSKKHAIGLVDQAVKTICDIWRSDDIPTVFLTADRATLAQLTVKVPPVASTSDLLSKSRKRNTQLPSPISPKTQPSPPSANCTPATAIEIEPTCMFGSKSNLIPIKGFVHEVLRRSRTSGCVLQTALCYLEAIRPRLPDLLKQERAGQGLMIEPEISTRISLATPAEWDNDYDSTCSDDGMDTVRINDAGSATISLESHELIPEGDTLKKAKGPSPPLSPLPPLPSPLLCPRRAFLAALILASKFTQDKCYSNRAWAKLSGLPAREIGRCERALGDALDWRLWVGKQAQTASVTPPSPPLVSRPVTRCRSESDLRMERLATFLVSPEEQKPTSARSSLVPVGTSKLTGLRRASTLPPDAFSAPRMDINEPEDHNMSSPEASYSQQSIQYSDEEYPIDYPPTEVVYPINSFNSPGTPCLTYSPSSTESSSGDRTIQTSFLDETVPPLPPGVTGTDPLIWSETSPPHLGTIYNANPTWSSFTSFTSYSAIHHIPSTYDSKHLRKDGFSVEFDQNPYGFPTIQVDN